MTIRYKFPFKNVDLAEKVNKILAEYNVPLTLRQVYYRLVSIGLKNARNVYTNLSGKLSRLRERGMVSWESIIDLRRQPEKTPSWTSPKSFFVTVGQSYKRSLQQGQPNYTEVWCEKAVAISHIINKYDVPLLAGGGYRSSSALYDAAERIREQDKPGVILYMGDFDPSGLDIERDIKTKMEEVFHVEVEVQRVLLTFEDITDYDLLPNPVKPKDPRTRQYVERYGFENAYELDALPPNIISERLEEAIRRKLDMDLFLNQMSRWEKDNAEIAEFIDSWNTRQSNRN